MHVHKSLCLAVCLTLIPIVPVIPVTPLSLTPFATAQARENRSLRVVVLPFKNVTRQPQDDWLSDSFAETLTMGLVKVDALDLIERSQIRQLMKEQQFGQSVFGDSETAPQLGKMLGANVVVLGSYQKVGETLQANVRFVDVETGKVDARRVSQVEGPVKDIFRLQRDLAKRLVEQLDVKTTAQDVRNVQKAMDNTTSTEAHRLYIEGLQYMEYQGKSNYELAIKSFEKALIEDKDYPQVYAALAEVHARMAGLKTHYVLAPGMMMSHTVDHEALAEDYALQALERKADMPEVYRAVATLHRLRQDLPEARKMIATAVQLNPRDHENFSLYVAIRQEESNFMVPLNALRQELKTLGVDLEDPWLKFNLGSFMLMQNQDPLAKRQRENSIKLLEEAHAALPHFPGITLVLAGAELAARQRKKALDYVNQTLELAEKYPYYRAAAIQLLSGLGEPERALGLAEKLAQEYPENRQIQSTHAMLLMQGKRIQEGKEIFDALEKTYQNDPMLAFNRGLAAFIYQKDYALAKEYLLTAKQHYNSSSFGLSDAFIDNFLGTVHINLKEYPEAITLFENILTNPHFNRQAYESLSLAYSKTGDHEKALANYETYAQAYPVIAKDTYRQRKLKEYQLRYAISQQPEDAPLHNDLGQILQVQHHYDEALKHYEKALSIAPEHPVILFNLGSLHLATRAYEKAQNALLKAVQFKPDYAKAWFNLGLTQKALGNRQKAKEAFERTLSLSENYAEAAAELKRLDIPSGAPL